MIKKHDTLFGNIILMITAIIWGSAFVSQRAAMEFIGPVTFLMSRSLLAVIFLLFTLIIKSKISSPNINSNKESGKNYSVIKGGIMCGLFLFAASGLQQIGITNTSASKTGFISAIYVVLVPIFGIFLKHKIKKQVWVSVVVATLGLYLLCVTESFYMNKSDMIVLIGSFFWAAQIITVDYFSPYVDPVKLALIQFSTCFLLASVATMIFEDPDISSIMACKWHVVYAGVFASGLAFTLQMLGQKFARAAVAAIIMSLESVFGALSGALFLGERMTGREMLGCVLVFGAIILAQVSLPKLKKGPHV